LQLPASECYVEVEGSEAFVPDDWEESVDKMLRVHAVSFTVDGWKLKSLCLNEEMLCSLGLQIKFKRRSENFFTNSVLEHPQNTSS
jgi:hypothetical protein